MIIIQCINKSIKKGSKIIKKVIVHLIKISLLYYQQMEIESWVPVINSFKDETFFNNSIFINHNQKVTTMSKRTLDELMADPNLPSKKEDRIEFLVDNGIKYAIAKQTCSKGTHKVDQMSVLVTIFRTEQGRKEAVARALVETDYTESTINHFYNAVTFAKEWSKQEQTK